MSNKITADPETMMRQGAMTADYMMLILIKNIDATLGKGYAKKHPELLGQMILAATLDSSATLIAQKIEEINE